MRSVSYLWCIKEKLTGRRRKLLTLPVFEDNPLFGSPPARQGDDNVNQSNSH